jgi:hypothetical protein
LLIGLTQNRAAAPEHVAAMRKLMRAVPEPFREGASRVAEATVRDAAWGESDDTSERARVSELQRAIAGRRSIRIDYESHRGSARLDLVPLVIGSRGTRWYLLAAPPRAGASPTSMDCARTVSTIAALTALAERGDPPPVSTPPGRGGAWSTTSSSSAARFARSSASSPGRCVP